MKVKRIRLYVLCCIGGEKNLGQLCDNEEKKVILSPEELIHTANPGQTQNMLERLHFASVFGTPQHLSGETGGSD